MFEGRFHIRRPHVHAHTLDRSQLLFRHTPVPSGKGAFPATLANKMNWAVGIVGNRRVIIMAFPEGCLVNTDVNMPATLSSGQPTQNSMRLDAVNRFAAQDQLPVCCQNTDLLNPINHMGFEGRCKTATPYHIRGIPKVWNHCGLCVSTPPSWAEVRDR